MAHYAGARQTVLEGGDHGFTQWGGILTQFSICRTAEMSAPILMPAASRPGARSGFNRIAAVTPTAPPARQPAGRTARCRTFGAGRKVLDLAAGPGLLARDATRRVLPDGWVLASDIAENMLAERSAAGQRRRPAGSPRPRRLSTSAFADASVDVALIGLGLFIFPEPRRWQSVRLLRPGGRQVAIGVGARG